MSNQHTSLVDAHVLNRVIAARQSDERQKAAEKVASELEQRFLTRLLEPGSLSASETRSSSAEWLERVGAACLKRSQEVRRG